MRGIANYLLSHFKGKYRILCEYDKNTNQFPRTLKDTFEDIDCYISCRNDIQVFHYGRGILEAYVPSKGRGRNIIKAIRSDLGDGIIFNIVESDTEVIFWFHAKDMERLEAYLKPRTSGANISPFSSRNLPKNKAYEIPDVDLATYKNLIQNVPQNQRIILSHVTNAFLKSLASKKNPWEAIKADMALKGLKGKEYIHLIGQWDKYIKHLRKELECLKSNQDIKSEVLE